MANSPADRSARLNLPFIQPAQAQKHVTHNEALLVLDALVQTAATEVNAVTPPQAAADGTLYALGGAPTGDWAGHPFALALRDTGLWVFVDPQPGWLVWDLAQNQLMVFRDGAWAVVTGPSDMLGVNTSADAINRLAVASEASLFTHEGAGHQIKVNKAATTDTASLLFQSAWTGHAEMGLAGTDAFSIKVSPDGSTWTDALTFDPATGHAAGAAVQQTAEDTTPGRLMRADWGYGPGNAVGPVSELGGVPTGAVVERGENANGHYTRWADGTQICWASDFVLSVTNASVLQDFWTYPAAFAAAPRVTLGLSLMSANWSGISRNQVSATGPILAPTTTNVKLALFPETGTGAVTATVSGTEPLAIGRWY